MHLSMMLLTAIAVKLLISGVIYLKAKHAFARLNLTAKGAVIGSGWLFSYGVFHLLEEFI
jgi:hypothetical protein